jgi:uncharacterized protein (DUF111 family)
VDALPELVVDAVGYGAGTKRWDDAPNLLRVVLGEERGAKRSESAWILETNLDDLSPQLLAVALDAALAAGAVDAWVAPLTMKKGRPGHLLGALCPEEAKAAVETAFFRETSTLGVRATRVARTLLHRELREVETPYGKVRIKIGRLAGAIVNAAPEFEDCRKAAREYGVAVKEVMIAALAAFRAAGGAR